MSVSTGTIVDDRYRIISLIGAGGMGKVFKAEQVGLDRLVALKLLNADANETDTFARFEREAITLNALKHRNLVLFYGYGKWEGAPYMVMECVQGLSLQSVLLQEGRLSVERCLNLMIDVCSALACAHSNGVVHRDLKPGNIIISADSEGKDLVKVIDFGLAKVLPEFGKDMQKLTEAGCAVGSVLYMSPEQCLGQNVDARSDIYAVGCILQYCLTGSPPFNGEHSVVVMKQHLSELPPDLEQCCPDEVFPLGLQEIVSRALAKEPGERYQSMDAMVRDLQKVRSGSGEQIPMPQVSSARMRSLVAEPPAKKSKLVPILAITIVLISLLAIGFKTFGVKPPAKPETSSIEYFSRAIEDNIPNERHIFLLQKAIDANKTDGRLDPQRLSEAYADVVGHYVGSLQPEQALQVAQEGLKLGSAEVGQKAHAKLIGEMSKAYGQMGRPTEAIRLLTKEIPAATSTNTKIGLEFLLGESYIRAGQLDDASKLLLSLEGRSGSGFKPADVWARLGDCCISQKKYHEAFQYYSQARDYNIGPPGSTECSMARALVCMRKLQEATRMVESSNAIRQSNGVGPLNSTFLLIATVYALSDHGPEAVSEAQRALDGHQNYFQGYVHDWLPTDWEVFSAAAKEHHIDVSALTPKYEQVRSMKMQPNR